jgi:hypothetical protein
MQSNARFAMASLRLANLRAAMSYGIRVDIDDLRKATDEFFEALKEGPSCSVQPKSKLDSAA